MTAEGRIVGDPFVAMERIRRRVLSDPDNDEAFATAYTSYYIHERFGIRATSATTAIARAAGAGGRDTIPITPSAACSTFA